MSDLKMKLNTSNELKVKLNASDKISMKFEDYQEFKEIDPIYSKSPASTITFNDINYWNNKSNFSGNYNDLTHKPDLSIYATTSVVNQLLSNKVDKVEGMGLSQNSFTTDEKNKLASLENYDDTAILEALSTKADISSIPTNVSELNNDSGYITKDVDDLTNYPTNSAMNSAIAGKQNVIDSSHKLASDLVDDTNQTNKFFSGNYNDLTNKPTIPTATSDLNNDSGFITNGVNDLTNYTLSSALSSVATSGSYNDLSNKPTIPSVTSQSQVLSGNKITIGTYVIYEGTVVGGFSNGVLNLDITNLSLSSKPACVLATISSENYGIKYNYDSSSATSLKFELFNNGSVYNKTGNVRFSCAIFGTLSS